MPSKDLQELYSKFDGVGGDARLAWYGQERADGMTHDEAIASTFEHYRFWCETFWPKRNIELPSPVKAQTQKEL